MESPQITRSRAASKLRQLADPINNGLTITFHNAGPCEWKLQDGHLKRRTFHEYDSPKFPWRESSFSQLKEDVKACVAYTINLNKRAAEEKAAKAAKTTREKILDLAADYRTRK